MCGRFTISVSYEELIEYLSDTYSIDDTPLFEVPRYNVSPGNQIISILHDGKKFRVGKLKWGFIPSFAKDEKMGYTMINAKAETIFEKVSFKKSIYSKRCVVLADSFYEWKKENEKKIPMRIKPNDQKIFKIAAIYNTWINDKEEKIHTVALITTKANQEMSMIHDRMPVILDPSSESIWLNKKIVDENVLKGCLQSYPDGHLDMYQVSPLVNQTKNDDASLIEPIKKS